MDPLIWKNLCNDVIIQILSWLSVDSLLRFKTVSLSWLSLITNPKFAKLHLDHYHSLATTTTGAIHNPTILFTENKSYTMKSIDEVIASSSSSIIEKHEMVNSFDFSQQTVVVVGSCNGLICLHAYNRSCHHCYNEPYTDRDNNVLCLWNPSTKEFKRLPLVEGINEHPRKYIFKCIRYGFGYDHVIDDYKVIANTQYFGEEDNKLDGHYDFRDLEVVMVYTLGTNSWRQIQFNEPYKFELSQSVYLSTRSSKIVTNWTYVNGAFHHIVSSSIISFDIVDEVYRGVPNPKCFKSSMDLWDLTVLRGCLCVSVQAESWTKYMQVWMMVDYGVKESWTKLFNITHNVVDIFRFKPTWLHKNGEVMVGNSRFVIYDDPKYNQVKRLKPTWLHKKDTYFGFKTEIYTGSLVSLKSHYE